jgi:hypothetical protein
MCNNGIEQCATQKRGKAMKSIISVNLCLIGLLLQSTDTFRAMGGDHGTVERVDLRYSPSQWQSAICLPDDPHKSLVDRSGELLFHFNRGGREFGTRVSVQVADSTVWKKQELYSARVPIVETYLTADGLEILEEAFTVTGLDDSLVHNDLLLVHIKNSGAREHPLQPKLVVNTTLVSQLFDQRVVVDNHETITCSLRMTGTDSGTVFHLEQLAIAPGKTADIVVCCSGGKSPARAGVTIGEALELRAAAIKYWDEVALPYGRIEVPDPGVQGLINSSIRNIWQAREIKNGLPAFQVGPTYYRDLFIVDGAFILEAVAILGAGEQARNGVAYELTYQKSDGRIEVIPNYSKENGIVLWTCLRHAELTQDKIWLRSIWPKLERIVGYIRTLRNNSRNNPGWLCQGLVPPGYIDGGIHHSDRGDYSNVYWNLAGLKAACDACRWLGKKEEGDDWQKEYDDFMHTFRRSAEGDMLTDHYGNRYLPIMMGNIGNHSPQRAQWAFCHAVYPGKIFTKDDPLVAGNLAMLEATEREGMVYGTGWDATGIWNYFGSFYAHAWLWQGTGRKASEILYAYANHAAPVLDWREEQSLVGASQSKTGDMPHNWASAEFIRLAVHLLALDRLDDLHLLEGMPKEWLGAGMLTRLKGIATPFGPLTMEVRVDGSGRTAELTVGPLAANCRALVVHLPDGSTREMQPQHGGRIEFPVSAAGER